MSRWVVRDSCRPLTLGSLAFLVLLMGQVSCCMAVRGRSVPAEPKPWVVAGPARSDASPWAASVCRVYATGHGRIGSGSGVAAGGGCYTAWHVVADRALVVVVTSDGVVHNAVGWRRIGADGAFVRFGEPLGVPEVPLAPWVPCGEQLCECVGFWGDGEERGEPCVLAGRILPGWWETADGDLLGTNLPLMPGMSGSPLIVGGQLVAVASRRPERGSSVGVTLFAPVVDTPAIPDLFVPEGLTPR